MDRFTHDAADALAGYEEMPKRRLPPPPRWPPAPRVPAGGSTWAPKMTEAERAAFEQYVIDNDLPF